jgi:DNA polymerase III delta prime subunit
MSKKMTIAEILTEIAENEAYGLSEEHKAFLLERAEKASRKSSTGERKPTAKQVENAKVAEAVYAEMEPNRDYTVSEMMKVLTAFNSIEGVSASYCNAIVKKLKDSGQVVRNEIKGRAYFTKVEVED